MISDVIFDNLNINTESSKDYSFRDNCGGLNIKKEYYEIKTEEESKEFSKPKGKYELISIGDVLFYLEKEISICIEEVAESIKNMIGKISKHDRILIVGLGNRHISSDSLGAKVVGKINITIENKHLPKVMAIAPSVMGLTGIETVDIVEGIVDKVEPTHVIIIDSLCASGVERLGRSIQITNNGICPGAGIGNKRKCIGHNIADKVFSIGVPLLIYASTFVQDALGSHNINVSDIEGIMQNNKKSPNFRVFNDMLNNLKSVFDDDLEGIVVSIKDIEECVTILSQIIANAINIALGVA